MGTEVRPISHTDVRHYGQNMNYILSPYEIEILMNLDDVYIAHLNTEKKDA